VRSPTREETSKPVVHGDVHVSVGLEHFEKDEICIACVLDIVIGNAWNEADIIGIEVHGAGPVGGHEYGYAPLAREVKLPLGGIWMPVQLAHASRLDGDQCSATLFEAGKLRESTIRTFPPGCFLGRSRRPHLKGVLDGRLHLLPANSCLVLREREGLERYRASLSAALR